MKFTPKSRLAKGLATAAALASIGTAGVLATNAALNDSVTSAQITVTGGTLDLTSTGSGLTLTGADLSQIKPGESASGSFTVSTSGNIPATVTAAITKHESAGCISFVLKQGAATIVDGTSASYLATDTKTYTLTASSASTCTAGSNLTAAPTGDFQVQFNAVQA